VDDDVEIGANTCIDRGSIGRTTVGRFTKLDNLVHLAHNVQVGSGVLMAAMTGVAGSVDIGDGVMTGGQVGISGHLEVGPGARLAAQAGIIGDIPAGATVSGYPARDHREYLRGMASVLKLPESLRRLKELESRMAKFEDSDPS
jgi:UDP-3-O-[3-hydroxymyristoyl] glucosamine N-acyltransferase